MNIINNQTLSIITNNKFNRLIEYKITIINNNVNKISKLYQKISNKNNTKSNKNNNNILNRTKYSRLNKKSHN